MHAGEQALDRRVLAASDRIMLKGKASFAEMQCTFQCGHIRVKCAPDGVKRD
jgi:hypothetical protein